jgi:hypothetical protein
VEVAVDGVVASDARRDVAGLLHGDPGMRGADGEDGAAELVEGDELLHGADDEHRAAVARDARRDVAADCVGEPGGGGSGRRAELRVVCAQRRAVEEGVLAGRRPSAIAIHHRVAARRLSDGAVLELFRPTRDPRHDGEDDEGEPGGDRPPRMARAPTADRGHRPHVSESRTSATRRRR